MQYKTKNGAGTTSEALTEPQALDHAVRKETETPVDPHMELKIVEQAGTLGTSNKLLVLEQDSEEEAEKPVEALTEQQAVDQVVKQEAETPQDSPTDLGTVEQYETLRRSNKLTVEQHDKEEAGKPAETCTEPKAVEQEVLKEAERPVDLPMDLEAVEQAETLRRSNKLLAVDQDSKEEEAEKQAGASSKLQILEHDTKHVAEKSAEAMQSQPPEKTAAHSLRNIVKEAAVKSLFNTTIGKAALKVKKKIVKKNNGVSLVINEGSRNGEETRSAKEEFAEQENKKETETPVVVSTKFESSEQETGKEAEMPVETCVQAKAKASKKRTLDSLKARTKLMKKALPKTADGKAAPNKVQKIIVKKNKGVPLVLNERSGHSEAMPRESAFPQDNPRIGTATDGKNTARNERKDNSHGEDKNGKHPASADINESENMQSKEENVGKFRREKKCKNGQNHSSNDRSDNPKKEKIDNVGVQQRKMAREKKEKTGGLIFLCSAKTKPDCLNYRVMGLPESQKNMVLGIKPGLKLFLYDYDLKLMYGIYKSSSAGGKKLEPRAFGGAFPYQVRFKIHVDCFPLPESIFKKAMVENFVTKHKFKTELTTRQVRKLSELFQPLETHPMVGPQLNNLPAYSAREERARDGVSHLSVRKLQRCSERETYRNDHCASRDERRYPLLAHDRDQHFANQGVREEPIREMVLTEKEYRSYGLRGERSNSDLPSRTAPASDPYWGDYKRRRQLDVVHLDAVPSRREYVYAGSSSLDYQDYQACSFDPRREYPLADRYPDYLRRVNISSSEAYGTESDHDLHTREVDPADRIFSRSQPAEYDLRRYWVMDPDSTTLPVSSRYSFVGRG